MFRRLPRHIVAFAAVLALNSGVDAQVVFSEEFTDGVSTTGFIVADTASDCSWIYAPGGLTPTDFSLDVGGDLPTGAEFDSSFAFLDANVCGDLPLTVSSYLVSAPFDASVPGSYILSFSQQFRAWLNSFCRVEAFNGNTWNQVANFTGSSVGYPNPAVTSSINITSAIGASMVAQVRFHFSAHWDYWWALDHIVIEHFSCGAPEDLTIAPITTDGGIIGWTDNGSAEYQWAVTAGEGPDGTNELASGNGSNLTITGLQSGTPYTVYVRSHCGDGSFSSWSNGFVFITAITNDDCNGAIALTVNPDYNCGSVTPGTVIGATDSGVTTTCSGTTNDDVWFSFTATDTAHKVSLIDIAGSTYNMYMALWTGDCGTLELIPGSCSEQETEFITDLTPGSTYYLQVYTSGNTSGQTSTFKVCIGTPPPPPTNDECSGAISLTVNPDFSCSAFIPGTVAGATMSNVTSTCSGTADDDVWFSFTATDTMHRIMLFNSAGFSNQINRALWSGECGNPTLVPGSCNGLDIAGLTIGTTYYLQLYTFTSTPAQTATFNVCIGTDFENAVGEIAAPSNFSVYPNPASTELFIGTVDGKPVHVMVCDMVGHLVMDQDVVVKLNVTDLAPGSYSLVILDEKGTTRSHARFMKQ